MRSSRMFPPAFRVRPSRSPRCGRRASERHSRADHAPRRRPSMRTAAVGPAPRHRRAAGRHAHAPGRHRPSGPRWATGAVPPHRGGFLVALAGGQAVVELAEQLVAEAGVARRCGGAATVVAGVATTTGTRPEPRGQPSPGADIFIATVDGHGYLNSLRTTLPNPVGGTTR
jgi:hypothetical protein